jgi:polyhydroxybutyrate depolymerase
MKIVSLNIRFWSRLIGFVILLGLLTPNATAQYFNFNHDGMARQYIYYEPEDLPENAPLVFVFHGYTGDAYSMREYCRMDEQAAANGFAVCYPRGSRDGSGNRFWNVGYEFHEGENVDDIDFIRQLAAHLQSTHGLDPEKTFCTGISNGGDLSFLLACETPDIFKAVAPVCGTIMSQKFELCTQTISILAINGTDDQTTWYEGDQNNLGGWGPYLGTEEIILHFAGVNECKGYETEALPNTDLSDGSQVVFERYFNGIASSEVWFYRVVNGGHDWPGSWGNMDIDASEEIWRFFSHQMSLTSTSASNYTKEHPVVYPNPTDGWRLSLKNVPTQYSHVSITSPKGQVVFEGPVTKGPDTTIRFASRLDNGMYFILFNNGSRVDVIKFFVH